MTAKVDDGGFNIGFKSLSYAVKLKAGKNKADAPKSKTIIHDSSGVCLGGRLTAIMGPSGAGKTSLLDILAGRKAQSEGILTLGQGPTSPIAIQRCAAYVQQDDAITATQTAREAVVMAALLTLPRSMPYSEKLSKVDSIMKTFHLDGCADTCVGDPVGKVKGLSGGERKRCAVAMAAIREPQILFLDEPTSGLDAFKALTLIQVLKSMAESSGSTIISTIHQPSSDIFAIFDDLMLIFAGHIVFHAPALQAVHYFGRVGYECPQYANPADYFFMHILRNESESRVHDLVKAWSESSESSNMSAAVEQLFSISSDRRLQSTRLGVQVTATMWTQFVVLLRRGVNDVKRNKMRGKAFIGQSVVMAIILSLIWFQVSDDQNGVQDRAGVLFFITTYGMMQNIMSVLTVFGNERGAVLREKENGMYRTLPYFVSRVLCDWPVRALGPTLFSSICYWAVGFQPIAHKFITFLLINVLLAQAGNSMGLFLACIFPDVAIALAVAPLVILPLVMFSGFVLNPASIPVYLKWVEWLSPTKYAFAALAQVEFGDLSLHCTADQIEKVVSEDNTIVSVCGIKSGNEYLERLNIQDILSITNSAIFLCIIVIAFQILAFSGLVFISRKKSVAVQVKTSRPKLSEAERPSTHEAAGEQSNFDEI